MDDGVQAGDRGGLDPEDWSALADIGHRMVDDMIDHLRNAGQGPVWRRMPDALRAEIRTQELPQTGASVEAIYDDFQRLVQPYATGNIHPRFMGWVHGGGNAVGMLAELLAGGLNANLGGRDHAPIEIERLVVGWAAAMIGMPATGSGLLVTGSSMANFMAVLIARRAALGSDIRTRGLAAVAGGGALVGYAAVSAHGCVPGAFDMAGLGTDALAGVPVDAQQRMDIAALEAAIIADRARGLSPFIVVGTAGSVDCGAFDDLDAIADIAARHGLWFHVDGAFGALATLSPRTRALAHGIARADSLAFDFHKWAQVPYDCGCLLVRDPACQIDTFAQSLAYLARDDRALAGNSPWPCDLGPDLSRGFRALKVWMSLRAFGTDGLARVVETACDVARHLASRIAATPTLALLAPVTLNIVCFRVAHGAADLDRFNLDIVAALQLSGIAAPSTTTIAGVRAIRVALFNHRTTARDADIMLDAVLETAIRLGD